MACGKEALAQSACPSPCYAAGSHNSQALHLFSTGIDPLVASCCMMFPAQYLRLQHGSESGTAFGCWVPQQNIFRRGSLTKYGRIGEPDAAFSCWVLQQNNFRHGSLTNCRTRCCFSHSPPWISDKYGGIAEPGTAFQLLGALQQSILRHGSLTSMEEYC
jgi:hypothetical protein